MTGDPPPPHHDPWLACLDRWVLRILKLGCVACVLIFVVKIVLYELGYGLKDCPHHSPAHPASTQS